MAPPPDRLYSAARELLDAVVRYYEHNALDLPERRYVSDGPAVAWDCDQLVIYVERVFPGLADLELAQAIDPGGVRSARVWLEMVRCTPVNDEETPVFAVSPKDIDANAQLTLADAVCVSNSVREAQRDGMLASCHGLVVDAWEALGPIGGFAGGRLGVRLQLDSV